MAKYYTRVARSFSGEGVPFVSLRAFLVWLHLSSIASQVSGLLLTSGPGSTPRLGYSTEKKERKPYACLYVRSLPDHPIIENRVRCCPRSRAALRFFRERKEGVFKSIRALSPYCSKNTRPPDPHRRVAGNTYSTIVNGFSLYL